MSQTLQMSLNNISNEFSDYKKYKMNYECLMSLPIVKELIKENEKLRIKNEEFNNIIVDLLQFIRIKKDKKRLKKL